MALASGCLRRHVVPPASWQLEVRRVGRSFPWLTSMACPSTVCSCPVNYLRNTVQSYGATGLLTTVPCLHWVHLCFILLAGKQAQSPLALTCKNVPIQISQDLTQRQITCVVKFRDGVAAPLGICAQLYCHNIAPLGKCVTSEGGQMTQRTITPDCSWNINAGCTSPSPIYPGSQWSFGFLTSTPGPIIIRLGSAAQSLNGKQQHTLTLKSTVSRA